MYAPKDLVPGLQAVLERNSPIKYKGMDILPIVSSEKTEVSYYQDVFQKHSAATQNKQVLKVSGIPQWLKLESLKITAEIMQKEVQEHQAGWTVADLLKRLTPNGIESFSSEGTFKEILPGNRGDSVLLCFNHQDAANAWKCQEEVLRILSAAAGNSSLLRLAVELVPPIDLPLEDDENMDQNPEQLSAGDSSVSSSESSETPQRKYPGHEHGMDESKPQAQLDRFERLIDKIQDRVEQMYGWEEKMEKLTVSMTSMGTEISDLKTHSEANAKAAAIGPMSEDELDTFLTDRCLPKFMDRMIAKQNEANTAVTKHQQEMLEQSAKTVIADVVKEQLHLSYLTAEQNLITTFRKCLEEAVREMKKVAEAVEPIDPKQGDREEIRPDNL
jgi:hypothetical protein